MFQSITTLVSVTLATLLVGAGCSRTPVPQTRAATEGQLVEHRAVVLKQKGELMQKGEKLVADGRAMVARGNTLRDQGNALEGQNLVIDGEAKIRQGQNFIAQADALVLPSTQPSNRTMNGNEVDGNDARRNDYVNNK